MNQLISKFHALSDATRFAIVSRLAAEGEVGAGALAQDFAMSASAVSQHLRVLREAGLIKQRVQGQARFYAVQPSALAEIGDWVSQQKAYWNDALDRLGQAMNDELGG